MKVRCDYCGSYINDTDIKCPHCFAENSYWIERKNNEEMERNRNRRDENGHYKSFNPYIKEEKPLPKPQNKGMSIFLKVLIIVMIINAIFPFIMMFGMTILQVIFEMFGG